MKALTCEMCGSTNLIKEDGVFVCQSCGTKYSVEEARKMIVEGTVDVKGTVKVDVSDELKNLYEIARRAKDSGNSENATKYYDMILVKDPSSWEANYYVVYFKAMGCRIAEIWSAANSISNCLESVLILIKEKVENKEDQKAALNEILLRNSIISSMLFNGAKNHYDDIDSSIQHQYTQEYINNAAAAADIMYTYGNIIEELYREDFLSIAAESWKDGINIHKQYVKLLADKDGNIALINSYGDKIRKTDSSYTNPEVDTSGCYIATSIYGSYDCPEVWVLRRFRDYTLSKTWYGYAFIKIYYTLSPSFVRAFGNKQWFKSLFKKKLDNFVSKLQINGYKDTPYEDKKY